MWPMVEGRGLGFAYGTGADWVFRDVDFCVRESEAVLLVGPSGGGKSTLLRTMNGLVPHFHGGRFLGCVLVDGNDTRERQPRDLAHVAGMVFQEPEAQSVARIVEDEIAFGLENLGLPRTLIRKRLEEGLDALGIVHLRRRPLATLSGGELQRVALAAVLTMQPRLLLLDEPTSQLDPQAADDVLQLVNNLRTDLGLTVAIAEHRLERLAPYVDRVMLVPGDGTVRMQDAREAMANLAAAPPVARIGRAHRWSPLPLSVAEARRFAPRPSSRAGNRTTASRASSGPCLVAALGVRLSFDTVEALRSVSLEFRGGETVALMGRNGSGKTSLLRVLAGLARPEHGDVSFLRGDIGDGARYRWLTYVAQNPSSMLYRRRVEDEIADVLAGTRRSGTVEGALDEWRLQHLRSSDPLDLSVGERQRVAIAAMLAGEPEVILLDEPTRGMDFETKELLIANLRRRARNGAAVVLASHDVELAARCADRVVLLAEGEVIADGPASDVLTESMTFSTQANKLFGGSVLTVEDALGVDGPPEGATGPDAGSGEGR